MTHENFFFTSLLLRFKRRSLRHRLLSSTENLIQEDGQESIEFKQGHIIIFIREIFRRKKFVSTHLFVIKTVGPGELSTEIFGIHPGANLLLQVTGESKIKRTIQFFEKLQEKGVDFKAIPNSVFAGVHSRNEANVSLSLMAEQVIHEQKVFTH